MCGITGYYSQSPQDDGRRIISRMSAVVAHRGPDDSGVWWSEDKTCFFGHQRLSIIDLSLKGHQPMSNEDGSIWITYNGEVYNFQELRSELELRGHCFRSRTDTEVIIHGYEEYGFDVSKHLRGMFAFALFDKKKNCLLLARDRMGIKPLYYTWSGNTLVFASEIKSLFEFPGVEKTIHLEALREYLAFGKVYTPKTMFKGIYKFPAAHYATVTPQGNMTLNQYWSPYQNQISFPEDENDCAKHLFALFEESVRLRRVSDVPVGVFLSGGIDSTANVALMSRASGGNINTFTVGFRGQEAYDERFYARKAASYFKTNHEEIEVTKADLTDVLSELSYYLDEPTADATVIPIFFVSKLARDKGVIVVLNGDGGDELFCGYDKWLRYLRLRPYWNVLNAFPGRFKRFLAQTARKIGANSVAVDVFERSSRGVELFVGDTGALKGTKPFQEIIGKNRESDVYRAVKEGARTFSEVRKSNDYVEWLSYWGLQSEVEHVYLYRADRMGMANSIEIRVPFLDHHLVEFTMQMSQHLKYKNNETKYILKKALEGAVPNEFLYRKKQGFCVPIQEWAGRMINEKIFEVFPLIQKDWGGLSKGFIEEIKERLRNNDNNQGNRFLSWNIYVLSIWYEQWFK